MEILLEYFPDLNEQQRERFARLDELYRFWNARINVISRKDIDNLYPHHVLHSLALAKLTTLEEGTRVLDLGTGGGFPGIPLAIFFPHAHFTLIDGTRKKIQVVQEVATALELKNVTVRQKRAEEWKGQKFDYVVSRAVASLDKLEAWSMPLLSEQHRNIYPNGLWALKGGQIKQELKLLPKGSYHEAFPLSDFFEEEYFEEKWMIYVQG